MPPAIVAAQTSSQAGRGHCAGGNRAEKIPVSSGPTAAPAESDAAAGRAVSPPGAAGRRLTSSLRPVAALSIDVRGVWPE